MGKKLDESKLKANLKLTVQRLRLQKKKRANLAEQAKRRVADELARGSEAEARVTAETVLKEDAVCEAYEVLELYCELLLSRISVLKLSKAVPAELAEPIDSLCYAAARHQVQFAAGVSVRATRAVVCACVPHPSRLSPPKAACSTSPNC